MKTLERISNFIRRRSPATIIVSSVVVILAIGFADYFLGQNFSSALFFVVPVAVVTWYVGRCLIADQFRSFLRSSDLIARMGGDEFAILLPETGSEDAAVAMTKLQEDVNAASRGRGWPVTLSIGLVTYSVAPESLEEIIKEADAMMYAVKEKTKNNISFKTINYDADDSASRSVVRADGAR